MKQDQIIKEKVDQLLFFNLDNADLGINAQVEKGFVTLSGIVDVLAEKNVAEKLTRSIPEVKGIENALSISTDGKTDDDDINQEVVSRITTEPIMEGSMVGAETNRGLVTLKGHVETLAQAHTAQELASTVMGVKDIINQIKIGEDLETPSDDASLVNAVERAFAESKEVSAQDIKTTCKNRVIRLAGTVDSPEEKELAYRWASVVPGVRKVINKLNTRHGGSDRDANLTNLLRENLRKNHWTTPGAQIESFVIHGVAYLGGEVYSIEAKTQAEKVAMNLPGISQVQNDIEVARH